MKSVLSFVLVVLCLPFVTLSAAAQSMSHEEEAVRNAYAKLSFMCELVPVNQAAFDINGNGTDGPKRSDQVALQAAITGATPVFSLTDFRTSALSLTLPTSTGANSSPGLSRRAVCLMSLRSQ